MPQRQACAAAVTYKKASANASKNSIILLYLCVIPFNTNSHTRCYVTACV